MERRISTPRLGAISVLVLVVITSLAFADPFQNVSLRGVGQDAPEGGNGDSYLPMISPEGRYIVFSSAADNLVSGSNGVAVSTSWPHSLNVFVRDRFNQTTFLASVNSAGTGGGNSNSIAAGISTYGQYVLFESTATNLIAGDNNKYADIFVRDVLGASNILVSVSTNGKVGNFDSRSPVMTPDGRYVAFVSEADNLVTGDLNYIPDIYLRDLEAHTTMLVSVGARSTIANPNSFARYLNPGASESPAISQDGRYVAFYSSATNLIPGVTNVGEIYVRDVVAGTTVWASSYARSALQAAYGIANGVCFGHVLSADGQNVAFEISPLSASSKVPTAGIILRYNLTTALTDVIHTNAYVPNVAPEEIRNPAMTPDGRFVTFVANTNGNSGATTCVLVWDAQSGSLSLASGDTNNTVPTNSTCSWPGIDASGQFAVFVGTATNLVTNTLSGDTHIYVRDLEAGVTTLVDADANGAGFGVGAAGVPQISADGRLVAFNSSNGPTNLYQTENVFVQDRVAGVMELISAQDASLPPTSTPNGPSLLSSNCVSADGRYVAFVSDGSNLVANDTNGVMDVFVRDLWTGTNLLVSVGTNGVAGDGASSEPAISGDGRYVAFTSLADDLVSGDTNKVADVFLRDMQAGETYLISVGTNGVSPGDHSSRSPSVSDDGRFVLYFSQAWNVGAKRPGFGAEMAVLRDRQLGTNYVFQGAFASTPACMSEGGSYVSFFGYVGNLEREFVWNTYAAALVWTNPLVTNFAISADGNRLAYVSSGSPTYVSVLDKAANTNRSTLITSTPDKAQMRFSHNGRFLTYVGAWSGGAYEVFVFDCETGQNQFITRGYTSGQTPKPLSDQPDITADGRFVAFRSFATNIVPNDTNTVPDVFVYDRLYGTTTLLSASKTGEAPAQEGSSQPVFSRDGRTLVLQSWSADLAGPDFNRNLDIFAYDMYASGDIPLFSASVQRPAPGQGVTVTWPVIPGKFYRVQLKNALNDPMWLDVTNGVTILGNQGSLIDSSGGAGPRFYRVVAY